VAVTDDTVDPVNRAAAVIVGNAGAFAGSVAGIGGGDGSERAKAKDGGEEERAEFHNFRGVDCLFVFLNRCFTCLLVAARMVHCIRRGLSIPIQKIFSFLEKFLTGPFRRPKTTYIIERSFAATAFASAV